MEIFILDAKSKFLEQVIKLADNNSTTLGFLPHSVFRQNANDAKIIVATEGEVLCGYLLFNYNTKYHLAYIMHLCVDANYRGKGITKCLTSKLESVVKNKVGGIRVKCRKDYEANKIWPRLGFIYIQTVPGRSKQGSQLDVWRKDLPFLTLFSTTQLKEEPILNVCLDLNILSDYLKPVSSSSTRSAHALMDDSLIDITRLFITPELYKELDRDSDRERIDKIMERAQDFERIDTENINYENKRHDLQDLFDDSIQDQSDLSHIAWCAAANINFFITNDVKLAKKNEIIYKRTGIHVIRPLEFLIHLKSILRAAEYEPQQFSGSDITIRNFAQRDFTLIEPFINNFERSGKRHFNNQLESLLVRSDEIRTQIIEKNHEFLGLISWEEIQNTKFIIHMIKLLDINHSETIAFGIINWLIQQSLNKNTPCVEISDDDLSSLIIGVCLAFGFYHCDGKLIKLTRRGVYQINEVRDEIEKYEKDKTLTANFRKTLTNNLDRANSSQDNNILLQIEKNLWPLKLKQINIPAYVVSIKPQYARELFDYKISPLNLDLFRSKSRLLFNIENSYYRSSRGRILQAPARILWYVSKGREAYQNTMAIRAASYLDEIHIDKPGELYKRFQHLGIYTWRDVLAKAHYDKSKRIMAFIFSRTEVFDYPIGREDLNNLWLKVKNCKFNVEAPIRIADNLFWSIYKKGFGLDHEKRNVE